MFLNIIKSERLLKNSERDDNDIAVVDEEVTCETCETSETSETSTQTPVENKPTVCEPTEIPEKNKACDPVEEDESDENESDEDLNGEPPCEPVCHTCYPNEQCNYLEWVYVLLVNGRPDSFFEYKCNALRVMRERARNLCLRTDTTWTYSLARHVSEDRIDVVRRLNNFLITYDQVMSSFSVHQVFKKNTYN
jgi:hypothetical protein